MVNEENRTCNCMMNNKMDFTMPISNDMTDCGEDNRRTMMERIKSLNFAIIELGLY